MRLRWRRSGDGDNGGGGFLKARASRQKRSSKEEEDERRLNRFYSSKTRPIGPVKARYENAIDHSLTQLKRRKAQIHITVQFNG